MTLLLCGLAGFFVAQWCKTLFPKMASWPKITLAIAGSFGVAAIVFQHRPRELVIYGVAGAGLAVLAHKLYRIMSAAGDWLIRDIITKRGRG